MNAINRHYRRLIRLAILEAFKDKEVPEWLSEHPALKERKEIKKVFPSLGLINFEERVKFTTSPFLKEEIIDYMLKAIAKNLDTLAERGSFFLSKSSPYALDRNSPQYQELDNFVSMVDDLYKAIREANVETKDGKTAIVLDRTISYGNKMPFRAGEPVFRAYAKVPKLLSELVSKYPKLETLKGTLPELDTIPEVREFHQVNVPDKDFWVVFSGTGEKGSWDIATMSMRGIKNCQSWDGSHKTCLVGSIISKFVGIIYLTSGSKTEHGAKMMYRSIVRYGVNRKKGEPVVILDRMYPGYNAEVANLFLEALKKRTSVKILNYAADYAGLETDVPLSEDIEIPEEKEIVEELTQQERSYEDTPFEKFEKPTLEKEQDDIQVIRQKLQGVYNLYRQQSKAILWSDNQYTNGDLISLSMGKTLKEMTEVYLKETKSKKYSFKWLKFKTNKLLNELSNSTIDQLWNMAPPARMNTTMEGYLLFVEKTEQELLDFYHNLINIYRNSFNQVFSD